jgi:hypothetical protein
MANRFPPNRMSEKGGQNMASRLLSLRAVILPAALVVVGAATSLIAQPTAAASSVWNAKDSAELAKSLHYMHEVWNKGDMDAVRNVIAGDDVLVTFELGPDNRTPVPLRSREQILNFMKNVEVETGKTDEAYEMEMPKMSCRANGQFGVCTEECTVHLMKNGSSTRVDKLFGTAIAVKYPDGWKWIQWHMSVGIPAPVTSAQVTPVNHTH